MLSRMLQVNHHALQQHSLRSNAESVVPPLPSSNDYCEGHSKIPVSLSKWIDFYTPAELMSVDANCSIFSPGSNWPGNVRKVCDACFCFVKPLFSLLALSDCLISPRKKNYQPRNSPKPMPSPALPNASGAARSCCSLPPAFAVQILEYPRRILLNPSAAASKPASCPEKTTAHAKMR